MHVRVEEPQDDQPSGGIDQAGGLAPGTRRNHPADDLAGDEDVSGEDLAGEDGDDTAPEDADVVHENSDQWMEL